MLLPTYGAGARLSTPNSRMRALAVWKLAPLITQFTEISGQPLQQMIVERLEISMVGQGMVIPVV